MKQVKLIDIPDTALNNTSTVIETTLIDELTEIFKNDQIHNNDSVKNKVNDITDKLWLETYNIETTRHDNEITSMTFKDSKEYMLWLLKNS
jgi:hypothetical protein